MTHKPSCNATKRKQDSYDKVADQNNFNIVANKLQMLDLCDANDSLQSDTPRCFHVGPIHSPRLFLVLKYVINLSEELTSHTFNTTEAGVDVSINPIPGGQTSPLADFCRTSKWAISSTSSSILVVLTHVLWTS